jgi:DNA modification methylase
VIHHGDLFDVLPTLDAESIDACVTDPPYGIGFMGREWDTFKPDVVAKSAESGLRPHPLVSDNPNIAGRMRSPAMSPSQIGYDRSLLGQREFQDWTARWALEVLRVLKPGAYLVVCGAPRSYHRMACGLEDAGFVIRDKFAWLFGSGFPKNYNLGDGKGTALKPAHEPIALAWKPFKGSIKACHETHGTAALNIDACRVDTAFDDPNKRRATGENGGAASIFGVGNTKRPATLDLGRWPANVVLDEEAAAVLDEQTGELVSGAVSKSAGESFGGGWRDSEGRMDAAVRRADSHYESSVGGASRFYYVAKPSREERDLGCYDLTPRQRDESRKDGNPGGDNPRNRGLQPRGNFHPTVKPVELMRWLVRLVTPVDGVVLDPFMGSGTTIMAARYEHRRYIGIEREADYIRIAEARVSAVAPLFASEAGQYG